MSPDIQLVPLALTLVSLGVFFYFNTAKTRLNRLRLQQEGITLNRHLKRLIADLQQHRGMTSALLNGDPSFKTRLADKRRSIADAVQRLDALNSTLLQKSPRWQTIKAQWKKLPAATLAATAAESFRAHSLLIQEALYLMGDIAEQSQLNGEAITDQPLIEALWTQLPAAAEGLGQARAVGSGVAAAKQCTGVDRIRLRFLANRVNAAMETIGSNLCKLSQQSGVHRRLGQACNQSHTAINAFLTALNAQLIQPETPQIDAESYFSEATTALEAVFQIFDTASDTIEDMLKTKTRQLNWTDTLGRGATAAALMISVSVWLIPM